ncbi:hypothetical protein TNCV_2138401 [Trichonephila clavipes]|nr:hypothetical protein TNCV_2138401 [Trichonephila clavipes]
MLAYANDFSKPMRQGYVNWRIGIDWCRTKSDDFDRRYRRQDVTGGIPSRETIRRRLTEVGLRSRRPLRRLPLTPHHRQCRLDFADLGQLGV